MMRCVVHGMLLIVWIVVSGDAWAQTAATGTIAGTVRDTTGAVLPGVTVEASSPALIEKVRAVVTDDAGLYKIIELRPGTYSVTFTLTGFNTIRREGIEIATGFTAPVNVEMPVGSLQETITVTAASPIVDTQNTRTQTVLSQDILDTIPIPQSMAGFASLTLGATGGARDVGGSAGEGFTALGAHGSRNDGVLTVGGIRNTNIFTSGTLFTKVQNPAAAQEVVLEAGGTSAEAETGGVQTNVVPREGGNTFNGTFDGEFTNNGLQADNLSQELRDRGLLRTNERDAYGLGGGGFGGPVMKDRLWFYAAHRVSRDTNILAGQYHNKFQDSLFYEQDLSRPALDERYYRSSSLRLTWQASQKNKLSGTVESQKQWNYIGLSVTTSPEATMRIVLPHNFGNGTWIYSPTSRLLFEASGQTQFNPQINERREGVTKNSIAVVEQSNGVVYGARLVGTYLNDYGHMGTQRQTGTRFAGSYVTGSHAFKVGVTTLSGTHPGRTEGQDPPVVYTFRNQLPVGLTQYALPADSRVRLNMQLGAFAQDQWTINRLTLNAGVRFDSLNAGSPAQTRPAGPFLPELHFDEVKNAPDWNDVSPRVGMAYDLFGNGRTAVKASLGKYLVAEATNIAVALNPSRALAIQVSRNWDDLTFPVGDPRRGNFFPDCDLKSNLLNGECGVVSSSTFGTSVFTQRYDPALLNGWGDRHYSWQGVVSVQQQVGQRVGVSAAYYRTSYGNFTANDNALVTPAEYDTYCVTAPPDSRLPGGGGNQVCGLYDIKPTSFGLVDIVTTKASNFGERTEVYNGVDLGLNARFGRGGFVNGGVSIGETVTDQCEITIDSPDKRFCRNGNSQNQVKLSGSYPLPWDIRASATYQNLPGINLAATLVVPNDQIAPSLGRNLGACRGAAVCPTASANVSLIEPNTMREPRSNQLDIRLSKSFRVRNVRITPRMDIFNLTNENTVLSVITTFGNTWLRPGTTLSGRLFMFGTGVDF